MYGGYGMSTSESIALLLLYIGVSVVVFLIIRALVLWYFRINEMMKQLELTNALLLEITKVIVPNLPKIVDAPEFVMERSLSQEEKEHITKNWTKKDWDRFYETGVMRPHEPEPGEKQEK